MCDNKKLLPDLSRAELDQLGFGLYGVVDILNTYFTLPTGERLALRLWAPKGYLDLGEVSGDQMNNCIVMSKTSGLQQEHNSDRELSGC